MKIEQKPLETHQIELTVEVEPEVLEKAKRRAARQIAKRAKIPGFRPGKAPYAVVVRQFGEAAILEDAIEMVVEDLYPKVLEEASIEPYGPGSLESVESYEPLVFKFVVPLDAEVTLGDYHSIEKPYDLPEVTEDQVEKVIEDLRNRQAVIEPVVDRAAMEGDIVYIELTGNPIGAEVEENEDEEQPEPLVHEDSFPVLVKAEDDPDKDEEWPYPGFSRRLIGLTPDDELVLSYDYSDESPYEDLRGHSVEFTLKVNDVKARSLPELDDEFAATFGEYENLEELRQEIRDGLKEQAENEYNQEYDEEALTQVVEMSTIKYPPEMLENEINSVIHNLQHRLEEQNLDMDLYLKTRGMDMDALREEVTPVAETRLKNMLTLYEIAREEDVQLEPQEIESQAQITMNWLTRNMSPKDARRMDTERVYSNVLNNIMADMLSAKAMERLRAIVSGREEEAAEEAEAEEAPAETETEATLVEEQPAAEEQPVAEEQSETEEQPAAEEQPVAEEQTVAADETPTEAQVAAEETPEGETSEQPQDETETAE